MGHAHLFLFFVNFELDADRVVKVVIENATFIVDNVFDGLLGDAFHLNLG